MIPLPPKRILMTADTVGGVWTYALSLAQALQPSGIQIALATMGRALDQAQRMQIERAENVQVFESEFRLEWMDNPWSDLLAAGEWLLGIEQQFKPDLIHLNSYAHGALPWHAPKILVSHSCVLSWWRAVHGVDAPADWARYREVVGRGIQAADLVVAPSEAMLSMLAEQYGPFGAWQIIHNGRFLPPVSRSQKQPLILSAGRLWDEAKNVGALQSIAQDLDWPVCVAGEEKNPGSELSGTNGPQGGLESTHHLGRLSADEMTSWFARASIYVLPARYEPFGLSILEAALSGCALVLGDIQSLRELWHDAAVFVSPNDTEALKEALQALIQSASWRAQLGAQARSRAARYTPEAMAAGYLAAYAHALGSSRLPAPGTWPASLPPSPPSPQPRPLTQAA